MLGCFMGLGSPNVAELMSHAGFDWLVIETELWISAKLNICSWRSRGTETVPLVRLPSSDWVYIQRASDIGAMGIVVPLIRTAEEAQAIVRATRYPPEGTRGFGPLRAANYMFDSKDCPGEILQSCCQQMSGSIQDLRTLVPCKLPRGCGGALRGIKSLVHLIAGCFGHSVDNFPGVWGDNPQHYWRFPPASIDIHFHVEQGSFQNRAMARPTPPWHPRILGAAKSR